jgi:hypothetical protein
MNRKILLVCAWNEGVARVHFICDGTAQAGTADRVLEVTV